MRMIKTLEEEQEIQLEIDGGVVTFYWPCGDTFGFDVEALLKELKALKAAQVKLGEVMTPLLGFEGDYLMHMTDQDEVHVIERGDQWAGSLAGFDYAVLRRAITDERRKSLHGTVK